MAQFHDLPVEIMKLIFLRICDFHTNDMHHCTPDNMISQHPIIKDCRGVCKRWRKIIDWSASNQYQVQCCAHISLTLTNALLSKGADFVRSLVYFKETLTAARGRLTAKFRLELHDEKGALVDRSSLFLQLFIRGFEMMAPYRNELCSLTVETDQTKFLVIVMRFLTEPAPCARLNQLCIFYTPNTNDVPNLFTKGLMLSDMIDLCKLKSAKPIDEGKYEHGIFSVLKDLSLRCPQRLISDRQFSMLSLLCVTSLEISQGDLTESLNRLNLLRHTLKSLSIFGIDEQVLVPTAEELEDLGVIELPHLSSLQFTDVHEPWVWISLRLLSCPRLESITLHRTSDVNVYSKSRLVLRELLRNELGMTQWDLIMAEHIDGAYTGEMLDALEYDTGPERDLTFEGLDFKWTSFTLPHEMRSEYVVAMKCMKEVLLNLRPRSLHIESMKSDVLIMILSNLDVRFLQQLQISDIKSLPTNLSQRFKIKLPRLKEVSFAQMDGDACGNILLCFDVSENGLKVSST